MSEHELRFLYDPTRLLQVTQDDIALDGAFVARSIVVVESVTRSAIESAMERLARTGFDAIAPES